MKQQIRTILAMTLLMGSYGAYAASTGEVGSGAINFSTANCKVKEISTPLFSRYGDMGKPDLKYFSVRQGDDLKMKFMKNIDNAQVLLDEYREEYAVNISFNKEVDEWSKNYSEEHADANTTYQKARAKFEYELYKKYEAQGLKLEPYYMDRGLYSYLSKFDEQNVGIVTNGVLNRVVNKNGYIDSEPNGGFYGQVMTENGVTYYSTSDNAEKLSIVNSFSLRRTSEKTFDLRMTVIAVESAVRNPAAFVDFKCSLE